jgi:hypothetical protein
MIDMLARFIEKLRSAPQDEGTADINLAREAADEVFSRVKNMAGVEGVGISTSSKGYSVKINLSSPLTKEDSQVIPKSVKDVPVKTQLTGQVMAF